MPRAGLVAVATAWMGCASFVACHGTELDVIEARGPGEVTRGASGDAGATNGDAGGAGVGGAPGDAEAAAWPPPCPAAIGLVVAGTYYVQRATHERCLTAGAAGTLENAPMFELDVTTCAGSRAQTWRLTAQTSPSFTVNSVTSGFNLDIRFGGANSGTPALLFSPHQLDNQRFQFRPRRDRVFEVAPVHAPLQCLTDLGAEAQIWPCDPTDPRQDWQLLATTCE